MDEDDEDFYAPEEHVPPTSTSAAAPLDRHHEEKAAENKATNDDKMTDDLEEGEAEEEEEEEAEEEDESDSDIDIITERKDGSKPEAPPPTSRHNVIRNTAPRKVSAEIPQEHALPPKPEPPGKGHAAARSGLSYPAVRTSKIDVDHVPTYKTSGKLITEIDIDEDLKDHEKPWRLPGTDVSDYFNYGFDEFTWTLYCLKQDKTRAQVLEDKKEFTNGMMLGADGASLGIPGMPPLPSTTPQTAMNLPSLPGMGEIPPEMQAMMAQMMASGMDPTQLPQVDPAMFGMQQTGGGQAGAAGAQGQGFGNGQPGFGAQGQSQQQMGFGYDPSMMGVDSGRGRPGSFGGRGRSGNRRNW